MRTCFDIKLLSVFIVLSFLSSCLDNDFLDRYPLDEFSEQTYFKTETDLKLYVNKLYDELPSKWDYSSDNNSDNMVPTSINSFLAGTYVVPASGGGWDDSDWKNIRRTNFFLERYANAETQTKEMYAGEVHFFRALFYWQKVVRFGDVPLVLKDLTDVDTNELFGPRVDHKIVMNQVLKDLDFAVEHLPEKDKAANGRLHKDAALALKSRICLWEGTFRKYHNLGDENIFLQEAVNASLELMNKGRYALYSTGQPNIDYRNLFIQKDLSNNSETILHCAYITNVRTHRYTREASENNTGASKDLLDDYLFIDGKPIGSTSYSYSDDMPELEFANRDPRLAQTIATPGFVWQFTQGSTDQSTIVLPPIGTSKTSTGYWLIKGRSSDYAEYLDVFSDIDSFIFRYAEVLLNYAEAQCELNGKLTQDELDKSINLIRKRVGMPYLTPEPIVDINAKDYGYPISPLLYEIRRERRIELIGEGFRFEDILRWKAGKLIENIKTILGMKLTDDLRNKYTYDISSIKVNSDNYVTVYPSLQNGRTWNDKLYLYPLPIDEINLAGYDQNPGWE